MEGRVAWLEVWLAHPRQCIQTRVPIVANCALPVHASAAKRGTRVTGQMALSTTRTPHLPPLNVSATLGLGEEE